MLTRALPKLVVCLVFLTVVVCARNTSSTAELRQLVLTTDASVTVTATTV